MELETWKIIILIALAFFSILDSLSLQIGLQFPVIIGTITGIIVGDMKLGLVIGATLQLMVLGVGTYGGASVPDFQTGAIIGTAFAYMTGEGTEFALAIAVPVGLLMVQLDILARFSNSYFMQKIDTNIENMDLKAVNRNAVLGFIPWGLSRAIPVALMLIFGQGTVDVVVEKMPDWLMGGLGVAGGLLPVVGIAVLLRYLPIQQNMAYIIVGFFLASYLGIPMLGVALVGGALALSVYKKLTSGQNTIANEPIHMGGYENGEYEE